MSSTEGPQPITLPTETPLNLNLTVHNQGTLSTETPLNLNLTVHNQVLFQPRLEPVEQESRQQRKLRNRTVNLTNFEPRRSHECAPDGRLCAPGEPFSPQLGTGQSWTKLEATRDAKVPLLVAATWS